MRLLKASVDTFQLIDRLRTKKSPNWQGINKLAIFSLFIKGAANPVTRKLEELRPVDYKSGAVTTLPPYLLRKINLLSLGLSNFPEIDELLQPDVTTRLAGEVPSTLACEDIPEAHKFHSGKVTEYSFPAGKVNDNWNHLKTNLGQRLALQFSTPVPCAAARLRFFCDVNFLFNGHCRDV